MHLQSLEPTKDFGQSLGQLVIDKFMVSAANFSDTSAEIKFTLEGISLLDIRPHDSIVIRKYEHVYIKDFFMFIFITVKYFYRF